jgi:hypothetical protein
MCLFIFYFLRYVCGAGITLWRWLRRRRQRGGALHVGPLMTRTELSRWLPIVKGFFFRLEKLLLKIILRPLSYKFLFLSCVFCRMVAEINVEKKQKPQKVKPKTSADARKHLSSVRVIQRNLVYIIGLPNNLMDESVSYLLLTFSFSL